MTDTKNNNIPIYSLEFDTSEADRTTFTLVRDGKPIGTTHVTNVLIRDMLHNLYWDIIGDRK